MREGTFNHSSLPIAGGMVPLSMVLSKEKKSITSGGWVSEGKGRKDGAATIRGRQLIRVGVGVDSRYSATRRGRTG